MTIHADIAKKLEIERYSVRRLPSYAWAQTEGRTLEELMEVEQAEQRLARTLKVKATRYDESNAEKPDNLVQEAIQHLAQTYLGFRVSDSAENAYRDAQTAAKTLKTRATAKELTSSRSP